MEPLKEYEQQDATGLAELVATNQVHPRELVEAVARRVRDVEPHVNALVASQLTSARTAADQDLPPGPFAGVPILIKDLTMEAGARVSFGSVFFRNFVADVTTEFRTRLDRAGFIPVGRTNTPEFGLMPTTEPVLWGPTRNPWNLDHSAGGSSGGAAAAVAAGLVPLAHASDGGGSIRIPASACGLFGLKPSRGRNPRRPAATPDYLSVELALTRSVRDSARLLDAVAGPVPGDQYWAPPPSMPFAKAASLDPVPLTIAYSLADFRGDPIHPDCAAAVLATARLLEQLGHRVEEASPAVSGEQMAEGFVQIWASLASGAFQLILEAASEYRVVRTARRRLGDWQTMKLIARNDRRETGLPPFEPFTWALADRSRRRSQAELDLARRSLQEIAHQTGDFLQRYDAFLTPTLGAPPVQIGEIDQSTPWEELIEQLYRYVAFTPLANFSGMPAMSVPLHWNAAGLPIGSHFLGRFGDEETLFRLAGQLERARGWWDRRPPLALG
jgi:Asp-tRNA(Asn)/Glu-tRNA(Gln) amidotransferase A subunit family amidase